MMEAGFAGMMHVAISRTANPFDLVGGELDVIAACVAAAEPVSA